jgi:excisionase family DNA binding protein
MKKILQIEDVDKEEFFKIIEEIFERKFKEYFKHKPEENLSIKEVAKELSVTEITIHNYIKKGKLPAVKIGRRVFIKRSDLDDALKEVKSLKYKRGDKTFKELKSDRKCVKCEKKLKTYENNFCTNCDRVENLNDTYIKDIIRRKTNLSIKEIPKEMIELERTNILLKRELKK